MHGITVIAVPYHVGLREHRVGKGPGRLLALGLAGTLRDVVDDVRVVTVPPVDDVDGEIGRSFELKRRVATVVSATVADGRFPLVLAGNCNTTVGVWAGLGDGEAGVVWLDAHPDFDTPDERTSGYFDGMGVATLAGQCWHRLAATIPGFRPLDLSRLVYVGIHDLEPHQQKKIEAYGILAARKAADARTPVASALDAALTAAPFDRAVLHVDLDCLDISVGYANEYAMPGGLSARDLHDCLTCVCARVRPLAMTIASFNPGLEGSERIAAAGMDAARLVCSHLPG
jgi:arginase